MTLTIPEDILRAANLDERTLLIEFACRLYDARKLTFGQAVRLSGLGRSEFEDELRDRRLSVFHYDTEDVLDELGRVAGSTAPES